MDPTSGYLPDPRPPILQTGPPPELSDLDPTLFGLRSTEEAPEALGISQPQVLIDMSLFEDDAVNMWAGAPPQDDLSIDQQ